MYFDDGLKPTGLRIVWVCVLESWYQTKYSGILLSFTQVYFSLYFSNLTYLFFTLRNIYGSFYAEHSFCHL